MRQVLGLRQRDLQVVIENVHDPHNASAILRTCDGFAAGTVNLLYTTESLPEISEGVAGFTKKWLELRPFTNVEACLDTLRQERLRVYATHLDDSAVDFRTIDWTLPSAVVLGNEHRGCSEELVSLSDVAIQIPMAGMAQSFNVSVSAAIVLAEAARQRLEAGLYAHQWSDWHENQLRNWIKRETNDPKQ